MAIQPNPAADPAAPAEEIEPDAPAQTQGERSFRPAPSLPASRNDGLLGPGGDPAEGKPD